MHEKTGWTFHPVLVLLLFLDNDDFYFQCIKRHGLNKIIGIKYGAVKPLDFAEVLFHHDGLCEVKVLTHLY